VIVGSFSIGRCSGGTGGKGESEIKLPTSLERLVNVDNRRIPIYDALKVTAKYYARRFGFEIGN
jgi:hypothetical protein